MFGEHEIAFLQDQANPLIEEEDYQGEYDDDEIEERYLVASDANREDGWGYADFDKVE